MRPLVLFFILIPILEMVILIKVGGIIGVFPTVALVVLTAMIGVWLLRQQGLSTWIRVQEKLARGEIPGMEMLEGIMLLIGGALLLTPGFFTDILGFICLIPQLRKPVANWLMNHQWLGKAGVYPEGTSFTFASFRQGKNEKNRFEVEGEYTIVKGNSGDSPGPEEKRIFHRDQEHKND